MHHAPAPPVICPAPQFPQQFFNPFFFYLWLLVSTPALNYILWFPQLMVCLHHMSQNHSFSVLFRYVVVSPEAHERKAGWWKDAVQTSELCWEKREIPNTMRLRQCSICVAFPSKWEVMRLLLAPQAPSKNPNHPLLRKTWAVMFLGQYSSHFSCLLYYLLSKLTIHGETPQTETKEQSDIVWMKHKPFWHF